MHFSNTFPKLLSVLLNTTQNTLKSYVDQRHFYLSQNYLTKISHLFLQDMNKGDNKMRITYCNFVNSLSVNH